MSARVPISAPGSTLDDLHNDLAALTMALRLAEYGESAWEADAAFRKEYAEELEAGTFEHQTVAEECDEEHNAEVAGLYRDGAGGFEASALVVWLKERIQETENTISGLDGSGMPNPPAVTVAVEIEDGLVQAVYADLPARVIVIDKDDPDDAYPRTLDLGGGIRAFVNEHEAAGDDQDRDSIRSIKAMANEANERQRKHNALAGGDGPVDEEAIGG